MCPLFAPPKTSDDEGESGQAEKGESPFRQKTTNLFAMPKAGADKDEDKKEDGGPKEEFPFGKPAPLFTTQKTDQGPGKGDDEFPFGKPTPLFATQKTDQGPGKSGGDADGGGKPQEEGGEDAESFVPDTNYEPVVPLPALVEVKTGEEEEEVRDDVEVLVQLRCKLYRFDKPTMEHKERGTGEIKILHHPSTGRYRCVMRRDTTLKLCANFAVTPALKILPKPNAPAIYTWGCQDYSEGADACCDEIFTARFKDTATGEKFLETIKKVLQRLSSPTPD